MDKPGNIDLYAARISDIFRSPSLNTRKTLNSDTEEFITEKAISTPKNAEITINIFTSFNHETDQEQIRVAIHDHFSFLKTQAQRNYHETFQTGWRILLIALLLLALIFSLSELAFKLLPDHRLIQFVRESIVILGWVALWRPMESLLYDWYPIKRKIKLFSRLERCNVNLIQWPE